jgi:isocitrate lyase
LRLFSRRLQRALTDVERAVIVARLDTLGADRLGDVVLDLSAPELSAWLADPAAR